MNGMTITRRALTASLLATALPVVTRAAEGSLPEPKGKVILTVSLVVGASKLNGFQ